MIAVRELCVHRGDTVICNVPEFEAAAGERVCVTGPNGAGKTTLLRVLAGLEQRLTGSVEVGVPPRDRVFVHQSPYLFRGSVLANATYGLGARGGKSAESIARARALLGQLGIDHLVERSVHGLSGGERRRVALARALVLRPPLLLLDEPFADLDTEAAARVAEAFEELPGDCALVFSSPLVTYADHGTRAFELKSRN